MKAAAAGEGIHSFQGLPFDERLRLWEHSKQSGYTVYFK
jgi:hypothetical protein